MTAVTDKGASTDADWRNPLRDKRDKRMPRISGPCGVVIFGVTGDLATKKLMPAIYDLANRGLLSPSFALVGFARRDWAHEDFAKIVYDAVKAHARTPFRQEVWDRLAEGIRFVQGTFDDDAAFGRLAETLDKLDAERGTGRNHAFYLSIPPKAFPVVCEQLKKSGLAHQEQGRWSRVVIEKPFGHDLKSARELNGVVNSVFPEESVFRIDHYLGKETVQNILALRFANELYEPIWNANYVDQRGDHDGRGHRVGRPRRLLRRHRGRARRDPESPDSAAGVDRDGGAGQLQPARTAGGEDQGALCHPTDAAPGRDHRPRAVHGRLAGQSEGRRTLGGGGFLQGLDYRDVRRDHRGDRHPPVGGCAVLSAHRKTLAPSVTEVALVFKRAPHLPFDATMTEELGKNALVIRVQPDEGITTRFGSKVPGHAMEVRDVNMDFSYGSSFAEDSPEAYERLILDVLLGEPSLFPVNAEVELSWKILDPVLTDWARKRKTGAL